MAAAYLGSVGTSRLYPCKTKCYLQSPYLRRYTGVLGKYRFTSKMLFGLAFSITKGSNSTAIWADPYPYSLSDCTGLFVPVEVETRLRVHNPRTRATLQYGYSYNIYI